MSDKLALYELKTENTVHPLGIGSTQPLFGWKLASDRRAERQTAYRIVVGRDEERLGREAGECWDSGKVESDETLQIRYAGEPLVSETRYYWKAMAWDKDGRASEWSAPAWFETGLLRPEEWAAEWIGGDTGRNPLAGAKWAWHSLDLPGSGATAGKTAEGAADDAADGAADRTADSTADKAAGHSPRLVHFRKTFQVPEGKTVRCALFHGTGGSKFTVFANGSTIAKLNTRWKQDWTSPFVYIDFTAKLRGGDNVLSWIVEHAESREAGIIGKFELGYDDGSVETILTDETWRVTAEADATDVTAPDWKLADHDDAAWGMSRTIASYGDAPWGAIRRRGSAPLIRKEFQAKQSVKSARLHVACLGYFEAHLNGRRLGDGLLQPDYTQFPKRTYAITFDGTELLNEGLNCIAFELGRGHYAYGKDWIGDNFSRPDPATGTIEPKVLAQLRIEYADGTSETIVTDGSWRTKDGPTVDDNIWYGDKYDARLERDGWQLAGYADDDWTAAATMAPYEGSVESAFVPPIRVVETISCEYLSSPMPNVYVYDAGLITTGWAKLTVQAPRGTSVKLVYGEILRENGSLDIWKEGYDHQFWENPQEDVYIAKGEGIETWEPKFSYKGFRYIQIESAAKPASVEARVFHNDLDTIGAFDSSNDLFNRIHEAMKNTMLNNFHSIPTDTPFHEKRGWTGDGQVIAECASMNFDMSAFFAKWTQDIADSQQPAGEVAHTCPGPFLYLTPTPAWMSAFVIVPWTLYEYYGDKETLRKHYDGMKHYMQYELSRLKDGVSSDESYADWAVPGPFIGPEGGTLLATAYVCYSCSLMSRIAGVLGKAEDAAYYADAQARLANVVNERFYAREDAEYHTEIEAGYRQTSNVLPVAFGIAPEGEIGRVVDRLARDIMEDKDGHLDTGCFGTKYLAPVLTEHGRGDVAYTLATKETFPSWGYCLAEGGTSFWEAWESKTRSYDHYFLGTIDDWFFKHLAGIKTTSDGYKTSVIKPYLLGDMTFAGGAIETVRGRIGSAWQSTAEGLVHEVTVPVNTTAFVYVPKAGSGKLTEGGRAADAAEGVRIVGEDGRYWMLEVGSGSYRFACG
ncbi:glycoside hydrolase family 78 protein [Cohnella ginsengisoli]|uniref:alpha-L-rhamnosidase n=1 Tax=Cohnella ginsengisoli TaxID=425004 RepID=A0A9X4KH98_9BACL|nr:alpha-L-rhamnosidase [Cohnella ginsengisoli]MDG0791731.1 glycoside hydrolase family 78 protein [Cohnella ginsengisoli]